MSLQYYKEQAIFANNNEDGNSYFLRCQFQLPYVGQNGFGPHDDMVDVKFYQSFSNENVNSTPLDEDQLKTILEPQVRADRLPSSLCDPDFYRDLYEYGHRDITHSIYIWDSRIAHLEIDLSPVYTLQKVIFVICRMEEVLRLHELHCLVSPMPL